MVYVPRGAQQLLFDLIGVFLHLHALYATLDRQGRYHHPVTGQFCSREVYEQTAAELKGPSASQPVTPTETSPIMSDFTKVKLPPWQPAEPDFWFELADEQFALYDPQPSEKQKSALAGTVIPIDVLKVHRTARADAAKPYTKLKEAICGAKTKSDIELCTTLLEARLGAEEQPSDFLRKFFTTFADVKSSDGKPMATAARVKGWLAKQILEHQIPTVVSSALLEDKLDAASSQTYMDKTDRQMQAFKANQATVASVAAAAAAAAKADEVAAIRQAKQPGRKGSKKSGGGKKIGGKDGKCFFHTKYGADAWNCEGECTEKGKPLAKKTDTA